MTDDWKGARQAAREAERGDRRYSPDEQRVVDYLLEISGRSVGAGDDPIGFLIASHAELLRRQKAADGLRA